MRIARLAAVLLLAASLPPLQALTLKLATLAPEGSPWVEELRQVAWQWERVSGGRVRLKIYAGGVAGEEPAPPENPKEMALGAKPTSMPIATGARVASKYEFARVLRR